jgi:hypothetical protein
MKRARTPEPASQGPHRDSTGARLDLDTPRFYSFEEEK